MRIALLFSNPTRDLGGMILLASELCRRGATCFLVPQMLWMRELSTLAPDFVLLPHMRRENRKLYERLLDAGIRVGVLDAEGGVLPSIQWYEDALHPDEKLRHRISCFCSWGERMASEAIERNWFLPSQIHKTGHPRFDLHAPSLRLARLPQSPEPDQYRRPLVLISGRFSVANPQSLTPEEKMERLAQIRNYSPEYARQFLETQQAAMKQMCAMTNELAAEFPGVHFVYRPHPFERVETYREQNLLDERENLIINREGSIEGWLSISDALIHRGCTTAIEGAMRGIPALSPRWIVTPEEIDSSESVSIGCEDLETLKSQIALLAKGEKITRPPEIVKAYEEVVRDWFYRADGLAHVRVAEAILSSLGQAGSTPDLGQCRVIFKATKGRAKTPKAHLLKMLGRWRDRYVGEWKSSPFHFDLDWTNEILDSLKRHDAERFGAFKAETAQLRNEYRLRNEEGCAIVVFAESKSKELN